MPAERNPWFPLNRENHVFFDLWEKKVSGIGYETSIFFFFILMTHCAMLHLAVPLGEGGKNLKVP